MNEEKRTDYLKKLRFITSTSVFLGILIAIVWQTFYLISGFVLDNFFSHLIYATESRIIDPLATVPVSNYLLHWDSVWYVNIAKDLYTWNEFSPAFYPLYPLLIKLISFLSFGLLGLVESAVLLNTLALGFAIAALIKISTVLLGNKNYIPIFIAVLFLASPAGIFLHLIYTEALYCALALWAYYFSLTRNWMAVGILLAFLTSTRITSVLIIALCGLEYLRYYEWNIKKALNKNILWFFLAPLGFIFYMFVLYTNLGDPLAMFHAYGSDSWSYHKFNLNIFSTIFDELREVKHLAANIFNKQNLGSFYFDLFIINTLLPLIALFTIFVTSVYSIFVIKKWGIPLGIYGLLSIVMFTLNSNIVSVHRYALPVFVIYFVFGYIASKSKLSLMLLIFLVPMLAALQGILFVLFTRNVFIG